MDARSFAQFLVTKLTDLASNYVNTIARTTTDDLGLINRHRGALSAVEDTRSLLGSYLKEFEGRFMNPPVAPNSEDDAK